MSGRGIKSRNLTTDAFFFDNILQDATSDVCKFTLSCQYCLANYSLLSKFLDDFPVAMETFLYFCTSLSLISLLKQHIVLDGSVFQSSLMSLRMRRWAIPLQLIPF